MPQYPVKSQIGVAVAQVFPAGVVVVQEGGEQGVILYDILALPLRIAQVLKKLYLVNKTEYVPVVVQVQFIVDWSPQSSSLRANRTSCTR